MSYEYIYMLKPIKEISPGWWKLRWKPIKHKEGREGTWNLYTGRELMRYRKIGCILRQFCADNGWGRSYDGFELSINLWLFSIIFWVKYNIVVMEEGPQDIAEKDKKSIDIPNKS